MRVQKFIVCKELCRLRAICEAFSHLQSTSLLLFFIFFIIIITDVVLIQMFITLRERFFPLIPLPLQSKSKAWLEKLYNRNSFIHFSIASLHTDSENTRWRPFHQELAAQQESVLVGVSPGNT